MFSTEQRRAHHSLIIMIHTEYTTYCYYYPNISTFFGSDLGADVLDFHASSPDNVWIPP